MYCKMWVFDLSIFSRFDIMNNKLNFPNADFLDFALYLAAVTGGVTQIINNHLCSQDSEVII